MSTAEMDPITHWVEGETKAATSRTDIANALGMSRFTYRNRRIAGTIGASELLKVAEHFHLDRVDALVKFGFLTPDEVTTWSDAVQSSPPSYSSYTL